MNIFDRIRLARQRQASRAAYEKAHPTEALKEIRAEKKKITDYNKIEAEKKELKRLKREQNTPKAIKAVKNYLAERKAQNAKVGVQTSNAPIGMWAREEQNSKEAHKKIFGK